MQEEPGYSYLEKRVSSLHHKGTVVPMETTKDVEDVEEPQVMPLS